MQRNDELRAAIACGLRNGRTVKEIFKFYRKTIELRTVRSVKRDYDNFVAAGGVPAEFDLSKKVSQGHNEAKDLVMVEELRNIVEADPGTTTKSIAAKMGVSELQVRRRMPKDLRYNSCAMSKAQDKMSDAMKAKRADRAKRLLDRIKKPLEGKQLIFFSDEKFFTQVQKVVRKDDRWLCSDNVLVLGVISNEGDVMPPHVFPQGLKFNTEDYIKARVADPANQNLKSGSYLLNKAVVYLFCIAQMYPEIFYLDFFQNSRAGHSLFISRFALALIWPIFRFAHRSIALRKTSGLLSEKSAKTQNRS